MVSLPTISTVGRASSGSLRTPAVAGPRLLPSAGLEQAGQAIAQTGFDALADERAAEKRIRNRQDAVGMANILNEASAASLEDLQTTQTTQDISQQPVIDDFGRRLTESGASFLERGSGFLPENQTRLNLRLLAIQQARAEDFAKLSSEAGIKAIESRLDENVSAINTRVAENPGSLTSELLTLGDLQDDAAPGLNPQRERERRLEDSRVLANTAIESALLRGDVELANSILTETPGIPAILGPDLERKFKTKIVARRAERNKGEREAREKIQFFSTVTGIKPPDMTEDDFRVAGNLPRTAGVLGREEGEKALAKFGTLIGVRPENFTPEQRMMALRMSGTGELDGAFGKSLPGRVTNILADLAVPFANGDTTEEEDRNFLSAINRATQRRTEVDPLTNVRTIVEPKLPGFVEEALRARGFGDLIPQQPRTGRPSAPEIRSGQPDRQTQATPLAAPEVEQPLAAQPDAAELLAGDPQAAFDVSGQAQEAPRQEAPPISVFEMARRGNVTGPVAALRRGVARVPLLGKDFASPGTVQAGKILGQMTRDLVSVSQNNPKFAEGERKIVAEDVSVEGEFLDNSTAFINRLIGIDTGLAERQADALATAQNEFVGADVAKQAMNVFNALTNFRRKLGLPPRVQTKEQLMQLEPGTFAIVPTRDGGEMVVPVPGRGDDGGRSQ